MPDPRAPQPSGRNHRQREHLWLPRLLPGAVGAGCPRLGHQHIWDQRETCEPQRPEAPRHWADDGGAARPPPPSSSSAGL